MKRCKHEVGVRRLRNVRFAEGVAWREIEVNQCARCSALLPIGPSDESPVIGEVLAAAVISQIEYRISTGIKLAPTGGLAAARLHAASVLDTGGLYGWGAAECFFETPPWQAGWLAAAYFGYDPHADADKEES